MKKSGLTIWVLLRLPILAAAMYLFRFQIATFIDDAFGSGTVIDFAVFSASTFWTRLLIYLVGVIALVSGTWLLKKWGASDFWGYFLILVGAFSAIRVFFALFF